MTVHNDLRHHHLMTHAGCMDGSAAAILFMHAGGLKENITYVPAGRVDQFLADQGAKVAARPLLLVDIAPSSMDGADFLERRGDFLVIDHHKSAEQFAGLPGFHIDIKNEACGCENFRQWLVRNHVPARDGLGSDEFDGEHYRRFTRIVDDHDRWLMRIPFSLEMPKFFAFVGQKDFVERFQNVFSRFQLEKDSYWTPFEEDLMKLLRRIQEGKYRSAMQKFQIRTRTWQGKELRVGYIVSDEVNNSEMLNMYLAEHPDVDVACQISFGLQKVSMRTNNRVDLARLCGEFRGGGHANAAGHPLPEGLIMGIIDNMHNVEAE